MQIEGRIALITGASFGIGAATARAMARAGARVVLLARTESALEQVAGAIRAAGGTAWAYPVDLADPEAVERVAAAIRAEVGVPDLIINNAGAGRWLAIEETSPAEAMSMMAVPYFAAFYVTRAFLPAMLARRSGRIVNVNSPASLVAWPGAVAYTAARWALRGFTEALRADLRGTGVSVSAVVPGKVSSTYFAHNPGVEQRFPGLARLLPTLSPEQMAARIVQGVRRDERAIIAPRALKLLYLAHAVAPGPIRWLTVATGWRRGGAR